MNVGTSSVITKYLPTPSFTIASRSTHLTYVGIYVTLLLLPIILSVDAAGERVRFGSLALPPSCVTKRVFDTNCPGCGLTRSFVAIGNGEIRKAARFHRIGPALYVFMILQLVHHGACSRRTPGTKLPAPWALSNFSLGIGIIAALILNWLFLLTSI